MPYTYNPITGTLDYYETAIVLSGTISNHGDLTGLSNDDHPQYHNNTRGDARYYTKTILDNGQLDSRYYTELEVDTISGSLQSGIDGKSNIGHTHSEYINDSEITTISGDITSQIITDHGELDGLSDDDHTQYILVDGTRGFTSTVSGTTPTENQHLATKEYVDAVSGTSSFASENFTLSSGNINNKYVELNSTPNTDSELLIFVVGGTKGILNTDYFVTDNKIDWESKDWELILEINDVLNIIYWY